MRKNSFLGIIGLAAIVMFIGSGIVLGQNAITGEWTAEAKKEKGDKIQLNFERRSERGKNQHGSTYSFSDLQGLNRADTENGRVSFRLVREAGTIECEGTFAGGRGSGTFRFVPNMSFADAMKSRGFDMQTDQWKKGNHHDTLEDRLFMATTLNITTALADDLRSANFPNLDFGDLAKAAIFKIDGKFMSEMKATGFPNLGMEDLVKARIFKIDAEFVRKTREMGFGTESFENLVKFSIFKVTPEFLSELKAEGLTDLTSEDVVKLRIFKIDAAYIREARASEPSITVEQLVQKRIGVRR